MQICKSYRNVLAAALMSLLTCTVTMAAEGIIVGRSLTLSGALALYGESKRDGGDAYIAKINAAGGVGGRRIELVTLDDGYVPANMVANLKKIAADKSKSNQLVEFFLKEKR